MRGNFIRPTAMNFTFLRIGANAVAVSAAAFLMVGCAHHHADTDYQRADFGSRLAIKSSYHGADELAESDVIGTDRAHAPTEADIQKALEGSAKIGVKEGEAILVLQSGQPVPDERLLKDLNKHFRAIPYTGLRRDWGEGGADGGERASKALRFAAAQAGAQKILCYWGELEVAHHNLSTKTITWLPVVDVVIPDQLDRVRMSLKVAIIDVKTGAWSTFRTEPFSTTAATTGWGRKHVESPEINNLKRKSYAAVVSSLLGQRSM
jgi:hypothetical protein